MVLVQTSKTWSLKHPSESSNFRVDLRPPTRVVTAIHPRCCPHPSSYPMKSCAWSCTGASDVDL